MVVRRTNGSPSELFHHGVKGMHWGVRRYQNPDGTLTAEGRQRYIRGDINSGFAQFTKEGKREFRKVAKKNREKAQKAVKEELYKEENGTTTGSKIQQASDDLNKYADEYANLVKEKTASLVNNNEFKKNVYKQFTKTYKNMAGIDKDVFETLISDIVYDQINKEFKNDKKMSDTLSKYETAQDTYWNTIHEVSKKATDKIGHNLIIDHDKMPYIAEGEMAVDKVARDMLDTSWNSHVYRHFEDYWVYENVDPKAYDQFTLEDYKKNKE